MAKDYRNKSATRRNSGSSRQLVLVLVSLVCGYLIASMFDLAAIGDWFKTNVMANQSGKAAPQVATKTRPAPPPKPKFEFYTLLSTDHATSPTATRPAPALTSKPVATSVVNSATVVTAVAAAAKTTPAVVSKDVYQVQIASFKNKQDAERMKALLILKGFNVNIATVTQQQINWYRVIIGPFSSRLQAEKAQAAVARSEHMKGMIRKMDT